MNWFINHYLWVVIIFIQYFFISYLSFRASNLKTTSALFLVWLTGTIPTWTIICKYANDIALAGYIYDFTLALGWTTGVIVLQDKSFTIYQYIGILLMIAGIMLFKKQ